VSDNYTSIERRPSIVDATLHPLPYHHSHNFGVLDSPPFDDHCNIISPILLLFLLLFIVTVIVVIILFLFFLHTDSKWSSRDVVNEWERGSEDRVGSHFTSRELMDSFPTGLIQEAQPRMRCSDGSLGG